MAVTIGLLRLTVKAFIRDTPENTALQAWYFHKNKRLRKKPLRRALNGHQDKNEKDLQKGTLGLPV